MIRMKKALSLALAVAMLGAVALSGCGKTEKPATAAVSATPAATNAAQTAAPEKKLAPVELTWYLFGFSPGKDQEAVEQKMNEYMKDKINASIKIYLLDWDPFNTKIAAMSASNEPFDIVFNPVWLGFNENTAKNMFKDITQLFPQYMPKTKALLGEDFLKSGLHDGKLYGIPTNKEKAHALGYFFNKQLVQKYNMDINAVKTPADIESLLQTIKDKEPGIIPLQTSSGGNLGHFVDVYPITGDDVIPIYAKSGETKVGNVYEFPETLQMAKLSDSFFKKGFIPKDVATKKQEEQKAERDNGKVFAYIGNVRPGADAEVSNDKVTWVAKQIGKTYMGNKDLGGSMNCISRTSKNPERALMFLEMLNTDVTLNNILAHGIEGKHYKKVSDNIVEPIKDSGYNHSWQWAFANQFINYLKNNEDPKRWESMEKFNKEAVPEKSLGFKFNLDPYKTEVAAIKLVQSENYIYGGVNNAEAEITRVNKKLKEAGIDKLIADVQKAYDEWLAKNGK